MRDVPLPPAISRRSGLYRRVLATVRAHSMLGPGQHVLAAVSGGADSVFLLLVLDALAVKFELTLTAAHLDHGLRGPAAAADAEVVATLCRRLGRPLVLGRIEGLARPPGTSLEAWLRRQRYGFLRRTARRLGADRVATGHTADDQFETVLWRLIGGAGTAGLAGILPVRGDGIIRPLLELRRAAIRAALADMGVEYAEDETNADLARPRNYIRHRLLPLIEARVPQAVAGAARSAELARLDSRLLERMARRAAAPIDGPDGLDLAAAAALPPALAARIVRRRLAAALGVPPSLALVRGVLALDPTGKGRIDLGRNLTGELRQGRLHLRRAIPESASHGPPESPPEPSRADSPKRSSDEPPDSLDP